MNKVLDIKSAIQKVKSGDTILFGGFGNIGAPMNLLYELKDNPQINHLTIVSMDIHFKDYPWKGFNPLLDNGQIDHLILSYFSHKRGQKLVDEGKVELTLVPQGTLAERIRAGGAGIGGFYTPTGVGTIVEEGKETKVIDGKKYILELPLRGNVALVKAYMADTMGNAVFNYTARNFNECMATAADTVILEVEKIVEPGEIPPDSVHLPGVFVDYIVLCEEVQF